MATDVEVDEDGNVIGTANKARLDRRNAIADSADEFRAADLVDLDGNPVQAARPPAEEEAEAPEEEPKRVEPAVAEPEPRKIKLKVNGRELELTEAEVIARAQKVESAEEYLRNAAELSRNVTQRSVPSVQDEPARVEEDDLALARAIQMGSEDEAVQAIRKIKSRPSLEPDAVARVVDERLSFRTAAEWFQTEYKELLADPILKSYVHKRDEELARAEPTMPYRERLQKVGDEVREWHKKVAGPTATSATTASKLQRKASVAPVPQAAGRQSVSTDEDGPEDPQAIIAAMAKSRKQERPVTH